MQKVLLIGYLGRDPGVKYSQQGTAIAQFSIATHGTMEGAKTANRRNIRNGLPVKAFNRLAEIAGEHLHKGSRIYVEGRKRTESWDDKQTGAKHYRDLVYADRIEFLDSKGGGNGNSRDRRKRASTRQQWPTRRCRSDAESVGHASTSFLQPHRWDNVRVGPISTANLV